MLTTLDTAICTSQLPFIWNGNPYITTGTYIDTLVSTTGGCDTIATLNLTVNTQILTTLDTAICTSQLPFIWNGNPYITTGTYIDTLVSTTGGCDTIATLNLTVNTQILTTLDTAICTSQLPFIWNGNPYTTSGTYIDTLVSTTGGCDTIATLNLTVNTQILTTLDTAICTSQLPFVWNGNPYTTSGTYIDTLVST